MNNLSACAYDIRIVDMYIYIVPVSNSVQMTFVCLDLTFSLLTEYSM